MKLGIFSKIFNDFTLDEAFGEIGKLGLDCIQFNMSNVGLESLPQSVSDDIIKEIKTAKRKHKISIPVVSGTFNTLELNEDLLFDKLDRFSVVLNAAHQLQIPFVSISTGSLNQDDFWSPHPENQSDKAWDLLFNSLDRMLKEAAELKITILIEPEQANVVQSATDALRLLEHYDSQYLKILYDPANLMTPEDEGNEINKIKSTLQQLHKHIAMAHLKDFSFEDGKIVYAAVGQGILPINLYLEALNKYYNSEVIMHGLEAKDIPYALTKIRKDFFNE